MVMKLGDLQRIQEIPGGYAGTAATVDVMIQEARKGSIDMNVRGLASRIVQDVPNKDYRGEADAIFKWVKRNIRYTRDPVGAEWVQTPYHTAFVSKDGDCDDHSVLVASLASAIGLPVRYITVGANKQHPEKFSHIYGQIQVGNDWLGTDTTVARSYLGWEPEAYKVTIKKAWPVFGGGDGVSGLGSAIPRWDKKKKQWFSGKGQRRRPTPVFATSAMGMEQFWKEEALKIAAARAAAMAARPIAATPVPACPPGFKWSYETPGRPRAKYVTRHMGRRARECVSIRKLIQRREKDIARQQAYIDGDARMYALKNIESAKANVKRWQAEGDKKNIAFTQKYLKRLTDNFDANLAKNIASNRRHIASLKKEISALRAEEKASLTVSAKPVFDQPIVPEVVMRPEPFTPTAPVIPKPTITLPPTSPTIRPTPPSRPDTRVQYIDRPVYIPAPPRPVRAPAPRAPKAKKIPTWALAAGILGIVMVMR